jgi:hypothetical protein
MMQPFAVYPGKVVVHVANGADCGPRCRWRFAKFKERFDGRPVASFLGSAHAPNIRAARFVVQVLAPKLAQVYFLLMGTVCEAIGDLPLPPNVLLAGRVSREEKDVLQFLSDVSINPILEGVGLASRSQTRWRRDDHCCQHPLGLAAFFLEAIRG